MKLSVLMLLVVFVSTTFAYPKYLRGDGSLDGQQPPSWEEILDGMYACGDILDSCYLRFGPFTGMKRMLDDDQDIRMMCMTFLHFAITMDEQQKRANTGSELDDDDKCFVKLFLCMDSELELENHVDFEGLDCSRVFRMDQNGGVENHDGANSDYIPARRKMLRQLLRKIYRKK